jgi:hypothetical protein
MWIIIRFAFHHNNPGHVVAPSQARFSSDDDLHGLPLPTQARAARNLKDIYGPTGQIRFSEAKRLGARRVTANRTTAIAVNQIRIGLPCTRVQERKLLGLPTSQTRKPGWKQAQLCGEKSPDRASSYFIDNAICRQFVPYTEGEDAQQVGLTL